MVRCGGDCGYRAGAGTEGVGEVKCEVWWDVWCLREYMKFDREERIGHAPVASSQVNPGQLQGSSRRNARMTSSDISTRLPDDESRRSPAAGPSAPTWKPTQAHSSPRCHMLHASSSPLTCDVRYSSAPLRPCQRLARYKAWAGRQVHCPRRDLPRRPHRTRAAMRGAQPRCPGPLRGSLRPDEVCQRPPHLLPPAVHYKIPRLGPRLGPS